MKVILIAALAIWQFSMQAQGNGGSDNTTPVPATTDGCDCPNIDSVFYKETIPYIIQSMAQQGQTIDSIKPSGSCSFPLRLSTCGWVMEPEEDSTCIGQCSWWTSKCPVDFYSGGVKVNSNVILRFSGGRPMITRDCGSDVTSDAKKTDFALLNEELGDLSKELPIIKIYPNPTTTNSIISVNILSYVDESVDIEVYNLQGQRILIRENQNLGNNTIELSVDNLTKGVYLLNVTTIEGYTVNKSLLIN